MLFESIPIILSVVVGAIPAPVHLVEAPQCLVEITLTEVARDTDKKRVAPADQVSGVQPMPAQLPKTLALPRSLVDGWVVLSGASTKNSAFTAGMVRVRNRRPDWKTWLSNRPLLTTPLVHALAIPTTIRAVSLLASFGEDAFESGRFFPFPRYAKPLKGTISNEPIEWSKISTPLMPTGVFFAHDQLWIYGEKPSKVYGKPTQLPSAEWVGGQYDGRRRLHPSIWPLAPDGKIGTAISLQTDALAGRVVVDSVVASAINTVNTKKGGFVAGGTVYHSPDSSWVWLGQFDRSGKAVWLSTIAPGTRSGIGPITISSDGRISAAVTSQDTCCYDVVNSSRIWRLSAAPVCGLDYRATER